MMKFANKKETAITLIALIITIIVLLILAGVVLNTVLGDEGIIRKSQVATQKTNYKSAKEIVQMKLLEIQAECVDENKDYTIEVIAEKMKDDEEILLEMYYTKETAKVKADIQQELNGVLGENPSKLKGIVVSVDNYESYRKYKFLIGESGQIEGIVELEGKETIPSEKDFKKLEQYEEEKFGEKVENQNPQKTDEQKEKESLVLLEHFDENENVNKENVNEDLLTNSNKKFGNASLYINNNLFTNNKEYEFTADFTIDFWINPSNNNKTKQYAPAIVMPVINGIWIGYYNGQFVVRENSVKNIIEVNPPEDGKWTHIAVCRKDGMVYLFYDGILQQSNQFSDTFVKGTLFVGSDYANNYLSNTYIDELRIINGQAKWTQNFDVPINEYEPQDGVDLYHFNGDRICKDSAQLSTETKKIGNGSKYFNDTYVEYSKFENQKFKFTGDLTIDFWINPLGDVGPVVCVNTDGGMYIGYLDGKFVVKGFNYLDCIITVDPPEQGKWTHVAVCRKGETVYLFYNGELKGTGIYANEFKEGKLFLGTDVLRYTLKNTYIDELRIYNGYCKWTSNFNP